MNCAIHWLSGDLQVRRTTSNLLLELAHLAQMQGAHLHVEVAVDHLDVQALGLHRFDMRRPLIDQPHIFAGARQVAAHAAADGARTQDRYFLAHDKPAPSAWRTPASRRRSSRMPPAAVIVVPMSPVPREPHRSSAIGLDSLVEQRLHGLDEARMIDLSGLDDLAAGSEDRIARLRIFLLRHLALGRHRITHGLPHHLLQPARPGIELPAEKKIGREM